METVKAAPIGGGQAISTHPNSPAFFVRLLAILDALIVAVVLAYVTSGAPFAEGLSRFWLILSVPVYQALFHTYGLYESHRLQGFSGVLRALLTAEFVGAVLSVTAAIPLCGLAVVPFIIVFALANTLLLGLGRFAIYGFLRWARRRGMDRKHICVVGTWQKAIEIERVLASRPEWGMTVSMVGVTDDSGGHRFLQYPGGEWIGEELVDVLHSHVVDEVLVAVKPERLASERSTIGICELHGVLGRVMIDYKTEAAEPFSPEQVTSGLAAADTEQRGDRFAFFKRMLDITGATAGMAISGIPMLLIAILIRLSSSGPIIFKQRRTGLNGRVFTIYKFRTMLDGADTMMIPAHRSITKGPIFKSSEDYRVTNVGHFLRRYSLDELPQFFNVLKGDMSLVGPRPLPVNEANAIQGGHRRRFRVLPGLTGIWQVSGRSDIEFDRWMKYDLEYVDNWSLGLDLKLLLKTAHVVLTGKGAY